MPLTLLETERPLIESEPEEAKIDFHLINQDTQKRWLIEITNFRLNEDDVSSDRDIKNKLRHKIRRKLLKVILTNLWSKSLHPQAVHRIGRCRVNCLNANRKQRDHHRRDAGHHKDPPGHRYLISEVL
jgi:hypothetical protein